MIEHLLTTNSTEPQRSLIPAVVVAAHDRYHFGVRLMSGDEDRLMSAELVVSAQQPVNLVPGDRVLCLLDAGEADRALILGRIGRSVAASFNESEPSAQGPHSDMQDTVIIEAKTSLTLRVGDGSITIREDGKILIKGKDLVSHAQRMNRIRGGAVSIN